MFCRTCLGPVAGGYARCYQCDLAVSQAGALLADAVGVAGYAVRGGGLAADLRLYKSDYGDEAGAARSAGRLRELLARFLRERGQSLWQAAGMAGGPAAVAVVPTGQGRPGPHPLAGIVAACVDRSLVPLTVNPGAAHGRGVSTDWVRVGSPVAGADVLVVEDTWVSGGSAQSAAVALKLAGARRVAVIALGRHLNPGDPRVARFVGRLPASGPDFFPAAVPDRRARSSGG